MPENALFLVSEQLRSKELRVGTVLGHSHGEIVGEVADPGRNHRARELCVLGNALDHRIQGHQVPIHNVAHELLNVPQKSLVPAAAEETLIQPINHCSIVRVRKEMLGETASLPC